MRNDLTNEARIFVSFDIVKYVDNKVGNLLCRFADLTIQAMFLHYKGHDSHPRTRRT